MDPVYPRTQKIASDYQVIRHRQHIGLQQLTALSASVSTILGPNKSFKFIVGQNDDEAVLACSAFRLLENMDLTCATGQLLNEAVQSHQKVYKTGSSTFMFMVGAWSSAVLECLHQGIHISLIVPVISGGLELCIEACKARALSIQDICRRISWRTRTTDFPDDHLNSVRNDAFTHCKKSQTVLKSVSPVVVSSQKSALAESEVTLHEEQLKLNSPLSTNLKSNKSLHNCLKLKHSRHFSVKNLEEPMLCRGSPNFVPDSMCSSMFFTYLAQSLCHGCSHAMRLVIDACRLQLKLARMKEPTSGAVIAFDVSKLETFVYPGLSENYSCVTSGFISWVLADQYDLAKSFHGQYLRVVFINGDATEKYRHVGLNNTLNVKYITDCLEMNTEESWDCRTLAALLKLKVNLILIQGITSTRFVETCVKHRILVVQKVKHEVFEDLAEATGGIPVFYFSQLDESCVGNGVTVTLWKTILNKESSALKITTSSTMLVTAFITSPAICKLQMLEDQFWTCAHRLNHALKEETVFLGAGDAEMFCIMYLESLVEEDPARLYKTVHKHMTTANLVSMSEDAMQYTRLILQLMANGWRDYISTVYYNSGLCTTKLKALTAISEYLRKKEKNVSLFSHFTPNVLGCDNDGKPTCENTGNTEVYDNVTVKLEAWQGALDLVMLVLQTDAEIVTGYVETDS
ncbi:Bardet-Biedl syndrome 12 protein [Polypterus senegalus]|nr:Bardet-Biedl syndrome 12 protein [Polypterus senegalus]